MIFTVHQAKTNLSKLLASVEEGEEVVIARGTVPVARLVPFQTPKRRPKFGSMKGRIGLTDAFFEPLPEEELAVWNGEGE